MSPEQAHGRIAFVDERSDIYGIGSILYFALTARPPFSGDDVETILERVRKVPPPRPSKWNSRVDPAIESIVARSMMKLPEHRFSSAGQLAEQIRLYLDGEPLDPTLYREPIVKRLARKVAENKTTGAVILTMLAMAGVVLGAIEWTAHLRRESDRVSMLQEAGKALGEMDPKAAQALYDKVMREDHDNEVARNGYLSAVRALVHVEAFREGKRYLEEARKARLATPDQAERMYDLARFRLEDAKRAGSPAPELDALIAEARGISHLDVEKPKAFASEAAMRLVPLTSDLMEPLNREQWPVVPLPAKGINIEVGVYQASIVQTSKSGARFEPLLFPVRIVRGVDLAIEALPAPRPGMVHIRGKKGFRPGNPRHDDLSAVDIEPFSIDRREVNVAEYRQFLEKGVQDAGERSRFTPAHWPRGAGSCPDPDDFPITNIPYEAAKAYARFRGVGWDLPTEAQWQLAASGGVDDRDYPWGARFIATCTNCATGAPVRVGTTDRDRSPFGVLDMGGNVSEYVDGYFDTKGKVRLAKGGSYLRKAAVWERIPVEGPDRTIGFRCVKVER
jgi:formylglycine-generating enzyme required for sulfatase activity